MGFKAGFSNSSGSDQLYIENSNSNTPLIYGEFDNDLVRINGILNATQGLADADGDTKIQVEESTDEDIIRFDVAGSEAVVIEGGGNVKVNGEVTITGGNPGNGKVLTSDASGNATWEELPSVPQTVYTTTTTETSYSNNDDWQDVTSSIQISGWSIGDIVKIEGNLSLKLNTGSGVDPFDIRVKITYSSCGDFYSNTISYTPAEASASHDNYVVVPYLDMITLGECNAGTIHVTLQARNTGDDAWSTRDRILVATKL